MAVRIRNSTVEFSVILNFLIQFFVRLSVKLVEIDRCLVPTSTLIAQAAEFSVPTFYSGIDVPFACNQLQQRGNSANNTKMMRAMERRLGLNLELQYICKIWRRLGLNLELPYVYVRSGAVWD